MRRLLNTLFVTSEDIYLSLDGENVVANRRKKRGGTLPPPYIVRNNFLFLSRRLTSPDGCLRPEKYLPLLLYAPRQIFGPGYR